MGRPHDHRRVLSRRQALLGLGALPALGLPLARSPRAAGARKLVVVWNNGGWDPTYVFDPHFGSAVIANDSSSTLATAGGIAFADSARRPAVRSFFERYGGLTAVVNGVSVGSISHDGCTRLVLTGRRAESADVGSLVASTLGPELPMPYVALSGPRYPGPLGEVMVPMSALLGEVLRGEAPSAVDAEVEAELLAYLRAEGDLGPSGVKIEASDDALDRWRAVLPYADLLRLAPDHTAAELLALGASLLAQGLCTSLGLQVPLPVRAAWDSHTQNDGNQSAAFENLFDALSTLVGTLESTPGEGGGTLLDQTTVLVLSEMGRTPVLNPSAGKDHWPYTSAMVLGAGVAGGRVLGATDETLAAAPVDYGSGEASASGARLSCASLLAGVLQCLDIDPGGAFPDDAPFDALLG